MVLYYGFAHWSIKWWKRVFFHLLDMAIVNAHILYNASSEVKLTQLEIRRAVAEGLLDGYEGTKLRRRSQDPSLPLRLKERPFPEPVPDGGRPDCKVCSNRAAGQRHQTKYCCNVKLPFAFINALRSTTLLSIISSTITLFTLLSHHLKSHDNMLLL